MHDNVHNQVTWHTLPGCELENTGNFTGSLVVSYQRSISKATEVRGSDTLNRARQIVTQRLIIMPVVELRIGVEYHMARLSTRKAVVYTQ